MPQTTRLSEEKNLNGNVRYTFREPIIITMNVTVTQQCRRPLRKKLWLCDSCSAGARVFKHDLPKKISRGMLQWSELKIISSVYSSSRKHAIILVSVDREKKKFFIYKIKMSSELIVKWVEELNCTCFISGFFLSNQLIFLKHVPPIILKSFSRARCKNTKNTFAYKNILQKN